MSGREPDGDLLVLAADKDMECAFAGILARRQSLGIRQVEVRILSHPEKDPGCLQRSHEYVRLFLNQYRYVIVAFDLDGCGRTGSSREDLESEVEANLGRNGWEDRAAAIVIEPELEAWVWSDSPVVDTILGWQGKQPDLRQWLISQSLLDPDDAKPRRPKEAAQAALRLAQKPRSSALYRQLAETVSLERCVDPSFAKLKSTLQRWFGI